MRTNLLLVVTIFGVLCHSALAQDDFDPQLEARQEGEIEYRNASEVDSAFDDSILSTQDRPGPDDTPNQDEVARLYSQQRQRIIDEAYNVSRAEGDAASTERVSVSLAVNYYSPEVWLPQLHCCPRSQNYGCRSVYRPLPCFLHSINGRLEWCCPFWPTITVSHCNCRKCAILTNTCASTGYCYRRYRRRVVYAVCRPFPFGWNICRRFHWYLPSSCYCIAKSGC